MVAPSTPGAVQLAAPSAAHASLVGQVADEFLQRREAGERPEVEEYTARHPEAAGELRQVLAALVMLDRSSPESLQEPLSEPPLAGVLGDFCIGREIGRGGMGVVYEAEQISLRRRVALKVLPFASMLDPRHLTRFQNEARAAATLNHPHIVPVYTTGVERGVHYLAMRLIDGESLAVLQGEQAGKEQARDGAGGQAGETRPGRPPAPAPACPPAPSPGRPPAPAPASTLRGAASSTRDSAAKAWYTLVLQWGIEAAEALEHAHSLGIVHRDIKPGNLLIDGGGKLWVTDFGLARLPSDAGLTMTGDLLGTLRYMSPEQALARHGLVDHRTDIYSLGATLYELLTGQPVVAGKDRQEILRSLAEREPVALRQLAPALPVDLETVLHKSLAREPDHRYATAQDFAADLRHVLHHEPIVARRLSAARRAAHWIKRRRGQVLLAAALLLVTAAFCGVYGVQRYAQYTATTAMVREALGESLRFQDERQWPDALAAAKRAESLALAGVAGHALREQAAARRKDVEAVLDLQEAQLLMAVQRGRPDFVASCERGFRDAFARLGMDVEAATEDAAKSLSGTTVASQLGIALDNWIKLRQSDATRRDWLIAVARQVDPHPLRSQVRERIPLPPIERRAALEQLAQQPEIVQLPPESLSLLAGYVFDAGNKKLALDLLRRAQRAYPGDMWLDEQLGTHNATSSSDLLPPSSVTICQHLGLALENAGQLERAVEAFRHAVELDPARPTSRLLLANSLLHAKHYEEAFPAYAWCYGRDPELVTAYYNSACAAALMQSEHAMLSDNERRDLRDRAYAWLQRCLKLMRAAAADGTASSPADLAAGLNHWQGDRDLASIRTPESLLALPDDERRQWEELWAELAEEVHSSRRLAAE